MRSLPRFVYCGSKRRAGRIWRRHGVPPTVSDGDDEGSGGLLGTSFRDDDVAACALVTMVVAVAVVVHTRLVRLTPRGFRRALLWVQSQFDVMIPDHRGTGRSSPLYCTEYTATPDPACIATALQRYSNATLAQFSVSNAARDINAAMDLTALADGKVYLYGVSYGTYLLQRCVTYSRCRVSTGGYCEVEWPWL